MAGLGNSRVVSEIFTELKRQFTHGSLEVASALFNGNAFVLYGPAQKIGGPENSNDIGPAEKSNAAAIASQLFGSNSQSHQQSHGHEQSREQQSQEQVNQNERGGMGR